MIIILVSSTGYFLIAEYKSEVKDLIGFDAYQALFKAKKSTNKKIKKIILGDSTTEQAYNMEDYNDSIYSLACNQAISLVGQYILLEEFLSQYQYANELEIFLIYRPSSFRNNLDQSFSYNYFLKPFYKKKYFDYITPNARKQIKKIPYYYLVRLPLIRKSRWSPEYRPNQESEKFRISTLSAEYLTKMKLLCEKKGVKSFNVLCSFLPNKYSFDDLEVFNKNIEQHKLTYLFEHYYDKLVFLDSTLFSDGTHLKNPEILGKNYLKL